MGLEAFLTENRDEIIRRCRVKVSARRAPRASDIELERGVPLFLDQLIDTLRQQLAQNPDLAGAAARHGRVLVNDGFTAVQVIHAYGDVCQSVTDLAIEREAPISNEDFRTLNRCLDDAIADAVTEFSRVRDLGLAGNERLGILAHEVRNLHNAASVAFDVLKSGRVGVTGATGAVLERSLARLGSLVDRSLAEVRLEVGNFGRTRIELSALLAEIELIGSLTARTKGVTFSVALPTESGLAVDGDSQILSAVIFNLAQNAIKFTRSGGRIALSARTSADRIQIDVDDECGGLPA